MEKETLSVMTEDQKLRLELYREFRSEAKQVYDFIMQKETVVKPKEEINGVYIIYNDDSCQLFDGTNPKDNVKHIGLKRKNISFAISLTGSKDVQLLDDDSLDPSEANKYYTRKCDALFDFDGIGNTKALIKRNPKLKGILKEDEYIPSLGQLNLMAHYKEDINDALDYIGAEPIESSWFWSSTESSQYNSWNVNFSDGYTNISHKYGSGRVRAVVTFDPIH